MQCVAKLNDEIAVGDNGSHIVIFGYFEDADGIHQDIRHGSVTLDDPAITVLKLYLQFDELEAAKQPPFSKYAGKGEETHGH